MYTYIHHHVSHWIPWVSLWRWCGWAAIGVSLPQDWMLNNDKTECRMFSVGYTWKYVAIQQNIEQLVELASGNFFQFAVENGTFKSEKVRWFILQRLICQLGQWFSKQNQGPSAKPSLLLQAAATGLSLFHPIDKWHNNVELCEF